MKTWKVKGGYVITTLSIIICLGVIHLVQVTAAQGNQPPGCNCDGDDDNDDDTNDKRLIQKCGDLASEGESAVCGLCPSRKYTPVPAVTTPTPPKAEDYRLPKSILPVHYDLRLQPYMYTGDPKNFTFKGEVSITVKCMEETDIITMHKKGQTIDDSSIKVEALNPASPNPSVLSSSLDTEKDFYTLVLSQKLLVGENYKVTLPYTAPLIDSQRGLFVTDYRENNQTIHMTASDFEPSAARIALPCFDEPALKAPFNITLVRKQDFISLSNMPVRSTSQPWTEDDGVTYVADNFETTPKMSTYLLAFAVCDFVYTSGKYKDIEIRAYTTRDNKNFTKWAVESAKTYLEYHEKYFQTNYSLPKLDLIGIPGMSSTAMENWGLVTFGEDLLLYKPGISSHDIKYRVAGVIDHELTHMWFGDLVSPVWWNDLWLNEAFAEYLSELARKKIAPQLHIINHFVVYAMYSALVSDSVVKSHPIEGKIINPASSSSMFDAITYSKGGAILRMLRNFLGAETFRQGLARYIHNNKFKSATRDDLWKAMQEQTVYEHKTVQVKEVMDTWITQMNYPVVTVSRDTMDANIILVKQKRFLSNPSAQDPGKFTSRYGYKWTIPITLTSSRNPDFSEKGSGILWMNHNETHKQLNIGESHLPLSTDPNGWVLANLNQYGFYRVNYQRKNWIALTNQLLRDHTVIPVINRGQIVNDALNLAMAGLLDFGVAMETTSYLDKEYHSLPWISAQELFFKIDSHIATTTSYNLFKRFVREKVKRPFLHYGLNNTGASLNETNARKAVADLACKNGIESCTKEASKLYNAWMNGPESNKLDPDMEEIILCNAIRFGGWREWNFAFKMHMKSNFGPTKKTYLRAMACSENNWILNHYLHLILDPAVSWKMNDVYFILRVMSGHPWGRMQSWNFFQENFDYLKRLFSVNDERWQSIPGIITDSFTTDFELSQLKTFVEIHKNELSPATERMEKSIGKIKDNIAWIKNNYPKIDKWLSKKYNN